MKDINLFVSLGVIALFSICIVVHDLNSKSSEVNPVPGSCTIFSASIGNKVLFGNNEDFYKPKTYLWSDPGNSDNYGCIYLGFKDFSHQGGINEKGLCFDANALPPSMINPHPELPMPQFYPPPYEDYMMWIPVLILRKAATVEEAVEIASKYQRKNWYPNSGKIKYQLNIADAFGDAVVISVNKEGELVFTRKEKDKSYLLSTNYNKANPENALEYPCSRYDLAEDMLEDIKTEEDLTVNLFKSILDTVHVEGIFNTTLYSNIFDLKNGIIYLYYWHQFDEVVKLNVEEELAKGEFSVRIKDMFSKKTTRNASFGYFGYIFLLCFSSIVETGLTVAGIHYINKKSSNLKFHLIVDF